jgi:hypothetical protein
MRALALRWAGRSLMGIGALTVIGFAWFFLGSPEVGSCMG